MLDRSTRAIETKKQGLQAEEKKLIAEMAAVKVMAKDLIRTRYQITKFYALKSQLQGVSLKIQFIWDSFSKTGFGYKRPELDMVD
ncbi:vacuolar protein sorting-associated protein 2 [Musa troglodytarum]|uniref:Vacuolar protein sorting-associated protein 2 n=1 Tax=Musa troglodytarum TaxID=320322 RepID=A0A9E7JNR5_9LILI|nr:vacuolar protein sorting-associated protein 2 [Musa troglodytarum]URD87408.1 vacuolar protein sorting-associated protein 2 [Musa troglodytarum]